MFKTRPRAHGNTGIASPALIHLYAEGKLRHDLAPIDLHTSFLHLQEGGQVSVEKPVFEAGRDGWQVMTFHQDLARGRPALAGWGMASESCSGLNWVHGSALFT
ncbi:hypothetical protein [Streptomyces sp. KLOTTS4A1]|uniref:hypothetical protein n=1 Tax=Streptomyces sp. KLOTTS4A1 TaxID=3390996 RepID=UPI0039F5DF79